MTQTLNQSSFQLNRQAIEKVMLKGGKYTNGRRDKTYVLPLPTREPERVRFQNGFSQITAGIVRLLLQSDIDSDQHDLNVDQLLDLGKFDSDDSRSWFKDYLNHQQELLHNEQTKQFTQLSFVPLSTSNERKGQIDFIQYVHGALIQGQEETLTPLFSNNPNQDLLSELLYSHDSQEDQRVTSLYPALFPSLRKQFVDDLTHLYKNPTFFLENLNHLLVHYTFVLLSQTVLQTNRLTEFDEENLTPTFFFVEWERASRWRTGYSHGLLLLKEQVKDFYKHETTLNIVSQLPIFEKEKNLYYHHIAQRLQSMGPAAEETYIRSIYLWMNEVFSRHTGVETPTYHEGKNLQEAFADVTQAVSQVLRDELKSRYPAAFESFILRFYKKHGGSLGSLLSLNQEQLLMLVACSVKEERIELKKLWKELEARGVWFDQTTQEKVVELLDELNYLEKKSDSGDAQYVKSIL